MKYITLFVTMLLLCGGSKVRVKEATSQKWAGGQYQSGYGTDYVVNLKAKAPSGQFSVDGIFVDDLYIPLRLANMPGQPEDRAFRRGEELSWRGGLVYRPDENGTMILHRAENRPAPVAFTGAALIRYTLKGQVKYQEIKEIKELEMLIYP
ncbi:MAG: hypothetical protein R6V75_11280 [Bacteroidales bacterium]